ncbi:MULTISPECIES: molybdopterin-dependent oxidoreductase [Rathayibacter]|jgi:DMSO/TMAO reductase YedYZ molybdopterin-dependent catalytic subunit|uniref:Sulfite oxidase-like oxidoreductase n=2 Tax=Rathayibacter festucae TaxID=110937 RepID=A0A3Q9UWS7_9MICO|nr:MULTISPECIES: molybdopterin-dependent oxidoreductase [Rathayibacter]AZZ52335.1 sulfite oxidase-like oxidoreductase [Rathayibacter festucae DSM 15932]MCJ1672452.1 molybdopterin-dependent oxidoreductase [Rathayibacter sp. VKM Ac-2929]MCJ1684972.1 molybdopterin-dependent oxidoreductase [Rathayibacter sp. VKM Ac-2928]MCJ1689117.1 molybdopterin-dependent oxidoreductase [Rathayibacter sp. VKM Ac-2927]MCJ1704683.1 molybdopterin-dependent oxidoreductase [Rathayibacter sp. VKM Ac-2926]
MGIITRGFFGKREQNPDIPPGQYLEKGFPVLSIGPTPNIHEWAFSIDAGPAGVRRWTADEFAALPREDIHTDLHCVTRWSKLATNWRGVSVDLLLDGIESDAGFVMAQSYGGYTTNLPLSEIRDGKAWIATEFEGAPLAAEHGGPARLLVPHLYLWKSAKWVRSLRLMPGDEPGFWEQNGYHMHGDPWKEERYW